MKTPFVLSLLLLSAPAFAGLRDRHASPETFASYVRGYEAAQLFQRNGAALEARLKLLDAAPTGAHARIATFEFLNGESTRRLARHVCLAATRGVRVQLLVDSKNGDRAGQPDPFDGSDDAQVVEELLQYMANCGAEVSVFNHFESWISVFGKRIPNLFGDPARDGQSVDPFTLLARVGRLLDRVGDLANEELAREGVRADAKPLVRHLRNFVLQLVQLAGAAERGWDDREEPPGYEAAVSSLEIVYRKLLSDPFWDQAPPAKLRAAMARFVERLRLDPELAGFYEVARRFNRVQHRKLFLVENGSEGCMLLGGRNLGDAYLTDSADSFLDGDALLCRHHGADAARALDEAAASFTELYADRADPQLHRARDLEIRRVERAPAYPFASLLFPAPLAPRGLVTARYRGRLEPPRRTLLAERAWRDESPVPGDASLAEGRGWRVLTSGWDPAHDEVRRELLRRIGAERSEIYLETAYAQFGPELRAALEAAMARGVRVRVVTNSFFLTDGLSKAIRVLMADWFTGTKARFGDRFEVLLTSYESGHMIHYKGAAFSCQPGENGPVNAFLLGSHNFHPRSGLSDKEHSLAWEMPGAACDGVGRSGALHLREAFYDELAARLRAQPLVDYPDFHAELEAAAGKRQGAESPADRWLARGLRRMFYVEGERGFSLKLPARVSRVLRVLDESGIGDLLGRFL